MTREPQYAACFEEPEVKLGPMTGATFRWNPMRLGWYLARYKFVAKMLAGKKWVAEIGCGDGFASRIVAANVHCLDLFDFDRSFLDAAREGAGPLSRVAQHDITKGPIPSSTGPRGAPLAKYNAIFMCDVLEHIKPEDEPEAMANILESLLWPHCVFIAGVPSLEAQAYAGAIARAGHVNCRTGDVLKRDMEKYFHNVFLFSMNDEVVHTGDPRMAHYLFALCVGPK